jgi:hypothetical protein
MNPNNAKRDPIIQDKPDTAGGSVSNASAGRVKSAGSHGPNFTSKADPKGGFPVPDSPYGKG